MTIYIDLRPDGPHAFTSFVKKLKKTRILDGPPFKKWLGKLSVAGSRGVYIIVLRTKSDTPWYVGDTVKSTFAKECSTPNTIGQINRALQSSKGTPLIYFIQDMTGTAAAGRGIDHLETELIRWCFSLNPSLLNAKKKLLKVETRVRGVLRSGKGKPSRPALALRGVLRV
jgi:hypothetical protein